MDQKNPDKKAVSDGPFAEKMRQACVSPAAIAVFCGYYEQFVSGATAFIAESGLAPLSPHDVEDFERLSRYSNAGAEAIRKTAVLKLNGGLGTTMGLNAPKSLIEVKNGLTFLHITMRQIGRLNERLGSNVPLLLMNSFFTDAATRAALEGPGTDMARCFVQHRFPRIDAQSLGPAAYPENPQREWNPAGHGDLLLSIAESGELKRLLDAGFRYLFVSNIDNLGASVDPSILGYFASENLDFLMEVTRRTAADRKGGHLARMKDSGKLVLREAAQCAPKDAGAFSDIERHAFFNTNNLWIRLEAVRELLRGGTGPRLPLIVNRKNIDAENRSSPGVVQLESALGSAVSVFGRSAAVSVPRGRFAPVKNCEDLLLVWSDCFMLTPDFYIRPNPERKTGAAVSLDKSFYSAVGQLRERFPRGAPSLAACESLSITGDVRFGSGVRVSGSVRLANRSASQAVVADNTHITADRSWP